MTAPVFLRPEFARDLVKPRSLKPDNGRYIFPIIPLESGIYRRKLGKALAHDLLINFVSGLWHSRQLKAFSPDSFTYR